MPESACKAASTALLILMCFLAGGAAWQESATVDEIAHVGAGLSYLQTLDMRMNPEHPPLGKALAAIPLAIRGAQADYSGTAWKLSADFSPAYMCQWIFGDAVLGRWNDWKSTLLWARVPMLLLTLQLGWVLYQYGGRLGDCDGGLLCLAAYVTAPVFLVFGPLVITDLPVTLFSLIALWRLGDIWLVPSRKNALLFGVALGASLLAKFTGLLLFVVMMALLVQTRFRPTNVEPLDKTARKAWRRARFRCMLTGVLYAAMLVYACYFVLSWHQSDEALNRVGSGPWAWLIRRPLMPLWLYTRGLLLMLLLGSRSTYILGQTYPHGVPYYFPFVFALKSTLGFLLLLLLAGVTRLLARRLKRPIIPDAVRPHWRILLISFFVFFTVCILSRLDISIRHFMVPIVLLTLMLAPLPRMISILSTTRQRRTFAALTVIAALSCFPPILLAYPHFFPFVNSLAFGHPAFYLLNDSNVSWNEGLPDIERFVNQQRLSNIALDWASLSDALLVVPHARDWDCQAPADAEAGHWVAVAAVNILENHNCGYLMQYQHRQIAGGSFYVFKLPSPIPPAGAPGGPPIESQRRLMWGMPFDLRSFAVNVERHPEQLDSQLQTFMQKFQRQSSGGSKSAGK